MAKPQHRRFRAGAALSLLLCFIDIATSVAFAQARNPAWAKRTAADALFHLSVSGTLKAGSVIGPAPIAGKAFAIAPNLLIAPRHVLGGPADWEGEAGQNLPREVERVLQPLSRRIEVTGLTEDGHVGAPRQDVFVLAPMAEELDAAALSLDGPPVRSPLRLSLCGVDEGGDYTAIVVKDAPGTAASLAKLMPLPLRYKGKRQEYGNLYVFEPDSGVTFDPSVDGHDGSPILDDQDAVVAMVSAVTLDDHGQRLILATPVSASFPGAVDLLARAPYGALQDDSDVGCSLSQTVRRIHDRIVAQAYWSIEARPAGQGGGIGHATISYESPASEPNVTDIKLNLDFYGKIRGAQERIARISDDLPDADRNIVVPASEDGREFETDEIAIVAERLIKPKLTQSGVIDHVVVSIFPRVSDRMSSDVQDEKGYLINPIIRTVSWPKETRQ